MGKIGSGRKICKIISRVLKMVPHRSRRQLEVGKWSCESSSRKLQVRHGKIESSKGRRLEVGKTDRGRKICKGISRVALQSCSTQGQKTTT